MEREGEVELVESAEGEQVDGMEVHVWNEVVVSINGMILGNVIDAESHWKIYGRKCM